MAPLSPLQPTPAELRRLVEAQRDAPFTYEPVGATRGVLPAGWAHDEASVALGRGPEVFRAATEALRRWTQFDLGWVRPLDRDVPLRPGATFGFLSRQLGLWSANVCRVVYVIDEPDSFGFAYGTVAAHAVRGEEQFLVTRDPGTDVVHFSIRKFSRPAPWLRPLRPLVRRIQERFTRDALARFAEAVTVER